ncbi:hypothetical protein PRO82_001929 [Candidatus Protochlamydia amoebophila]|nr:hypothetical protein [Candidatus Protochlamydia amoebophila]
MNEQKTKPSYFAIDSLEIPKSFMMIVFAKNLWKKK